LGIEDAAHAETISNGSQPFISKLSCSLAGETQTVKISPGTAVFQAYNKETVIEQFNCSYGLNETYRDTMRNRILKIVGVDSNAEVRVVELPGHRFFVATLFLPQLSSCVAAPHPLITAYMKAAIAFQSCKHSAGGSK
jgi:CTP synthase (UTP-ammonia lyase)